MATTAETLSALQSLQVDAEAAARALRHFALELAAMRAAVLHSQQLPAVGPALCQVGPSLEAVRASTDALLALSLNHP